MLSRLTFNALRHRYTLCVILLSLIYFGIELLFIPYATLSADDFWLSFHAKHYQFGLPYHDFSPYKTVLGYYIFLLPLSMLHGVLAPLLSAKIMLAFINCIFLVCSSLWLKKFFTTQSILLTVGLIIFSNVFLISSAEIRVDLFAYWCCLLSGILLLENKFFSSGIILGLGFAFCQKALWYFFATNFALLAYWLWIESSWRIVRQTLIFNLGALSVIGSYIIFWAYFSSFSTVMHSVFYDAYVVSAITSYQSANRLYWSYSLNNNPLIFVLWPCSFITFLIRFPQDNQYNQRFFITMYACVVAGVMILYKQPFAYNMLATIPACFLLYCALFSWTEKFFSQTTVSPVTFFKKVLLAVFLSLYAVFLIVLRVKFKIPYAYWLITVIPLAIIIAAISNKKEVRTFCVYIALMIVLLTGFVFTLTRFTANLPISDGKYQQYNLYLADALLGDEKNYLAGEPFLLEKNQPVLELQHIVTPLLNYLYQPDKKLLPVLKLSSLYLMPTTENEVIQSLKMNDFKLYINNDRLYYLPSKIKHYLASQYQHFWGSIYLYAPQIESGHTDFSLKFSGKYRMASKSSIQLDGKTILSSSIIKLQKGKHFSISQTQYRLEWQPEITLNLVLQYQKDEWEHMLD